MTDFVRKVWADNPSGGTPITAAELNRMEAGIDDAIAVGDTITPSAATIVPVGIKGFAAQTADLTQWKSSAGTVLSRINSFGNLQVGNGAHPAGTWASVSVNAATDVGVSIRGAAAQSANLQQWQGSTGGILARVSGAGRISTGGTDLTSVAQLGVTADAAGTIGQVVRAAAAQTADIQQWQNSAGSVLLSINPAGRFVASTGVLATGVAGLAVAVVANAGDPALTAILAKGVAAQTADLQQWQDSTGAVLARISSGGSIRSSAGTAGAALFSTTSAATSAAQARIEAEAATNRGLLIKGAASQAANLTEWQSSAGAVVASVNPAGFGYFAGGLQTDAATTLRGSLTLNGAGTFGIEHGRTDGVASTPFIDWHSGAVATDYDYRVIAGAGDGTVGGGTLSFQGATAGVQAARAGSPALYVRGAAAQTADLQQWRNSADSILAQVFSSGAFLTTQKVDAAYLAAGPSLGNGSTIKFTATASAATDMPVLVRGAASQSANLTEWQSSAGAVLARVDSSGAGIFSGAAFSGYVSTTAGVDLSTGVNTAVRIGGDVGVYSKLHNLVADPAQVGTTIKGAASQSADLQRWVSSAGTTLAKVDAVGVGTFAGVTLPLNGAIYATYLQDVAATGSYLTFQPAASDAGAVLAIARGAATKVLSVRGAASQSADLQQWQNSAGTTLSKVDASGNIVAAIHGANDTNSGMVGASGARMGLYSYWGIEVRGTRITTGPPTPPAGVVGDPSMTVYPGAATKIGLAVQGLASQSGNLQEWQSSAGTILGYVNPLGGVLSKDSITAGIAGTNGYAQLLPGTAGNTGYLAFFQPNQTRAGYIGFGGGTNTVVDTGVITAQTSQFTHLATVTNVVPLLVKGIASQSADLQQWQNSAGTVLARVSTDGSFSTGAGAEANGSQLAMYISNSARAGLILRGASGQTANLQEWQNSAGTALALVSQLGELSVTTAAGVRKVEVGAADSGGAGYRMLRVLN
jgi:hypothetical protein